MPLLSEKSAAAVLDCRWAAIACRDPQADGRFYYAVKTTGVYCRPSCGARTPRPENVAFFATTAQAEGAGFRPCRRCRPDQPPLAERQAQLVAASARGVCAILLGDDAEALLRDLQDRFPKAELIGGDDSFEGVVAQVVGFVELPQRGLDLPLDIRGTAFQQRVWQALQEIPAGTTASYSQIAQQIGSPSAARAVAGACAANALAVAIPCHRVLRNDGGISGYRWGIERKRELLKRELLKREAEA